MSQQYLALDDSLVTAGTRESDAPVIRQWITSLTHGGQGVCRDYASELQVVERALGANMSVDVSVGGAIVGNGTDNVFFTILEDAENLTLSAADGSNPRIDVIVVELDLSQASGSDTCEVKVVEGTPAASPSVPSLTQTATVYQLPLAHVTVGTGVTSISNSEIEDVRQWMFDHRITRRILAADVSATSSTLVDLTGFSFYAAASSWWRVRAVLPYASNTAGVSDNFKYDFTFEGSGAGTYEALAKFDNSSIDKLYFQTEAGLADIDIGQDQDYFIVVYATIAASAAGVVQMQFAKNSGSTNNTTVLAGAYFEYEEIT